MSAPVVGILKGAARVFGAVSCLVALVCAVSLLPQNARAQQLGLPDSGVLVIDTNQLFAETAFGKRVEREIEEESAALAAENRRIEAELAAEERSLTDERSDMTPEAFRERANAFDAKVKRIRNEQEDKAIALTEESDNAQRRFLTVARPVLETLMRESGAFVMLDRRAVLLAADAVDVTDEAVRRIDLAIGDGSSISVPPTPAPEQPESPAPPAAPVEE